MVARENKEFVRRFLEEICGGPKPRTLIERYVADAGLLDHIAAWEAAFPNYDLTIEDIVAEADLVALRVTFRGVQANDFMGIPATGKRVSAGGMIFYRVRDEKIVEHWITADALALMQQLAPVTA